MKVYLPTPCQKFGDALVEAQANSISLEHKLAAESFLQMPTERPPTGEEEAVVDLSTLTGQGDFHKQMEDEDVP